jgi:hypothetical protein
MFVGEGAGHKWRDLRQGSRERKLRREKKPEKGLGIVKLVSVKLRGWASNFVPNDEKKETERH